MDNVFSILLFCAFFTNGILVEIPVPIFFKSEHGLSASQEFPQKGDSSTPILLGSNPKSTNLPPKMFPTETSNSTGPPVLSVADAKSISDIKKNHESVLNMSKGMSLPENSTTSVETPLHGRTTENLPPEQFDMIHSKYRGGHDVDELHPEEETSQKEDKDQSKADKKASEKTEKKKTTPTKDLKSEVTVSNHNVHEIPSNSTNESKSKSGDSLMESTSKMIAVSSSVLSSAQNKSHGMVEPLKTTVTLVLSVAFILGAGVIGFLLWKKIAMRRSGRDVLINEDDFDELSDMHSFDRAQIKIT